ncbi:MAG: bifunctional phosphopantothenoylcysteine decarboxylase/phosphopantothenate--cysteine ligase CoaBC [Alphaproteobacteria bacterium]|nr:bifunctional phosphopantothenoylcysteine decarboxylase/phosphopantothenate--cysteine ligase CoaBC [Alphaproteobacteria bacterium]
MPEPRRILLIVSGGIAAYKSLELVRRLKDRGIALRCILTKSATEFVTPLSFSALSGDKTYTELFSLTDEAEMGHIRLSREADLVVVAPATANLLAKMANGLADDLASTALSATDKPVLVAPAMNPQMWANPATQRNVAILKRDGVRFIGPNAGDTACGEVGSGRMAEPAEILAAIEAAWAPRDLVGKRVLLTAGPTHEPIDPVRYIANRSSGKQGYAIATALAARGAEVTLVSGPTNLADPPGCAVIRVESARDMLRACEAALPADAFIAVAAVADWRVEATAGDKIKKAGAAPPSLKLAENPDILATIAKGAQRPRLIIGFAAETRDVIAYAQAKLKKKGCDWIVANDVSAETGIMGGDHNAVHLVRAGGVETWPRASKAEVAAKLAERIATVFISAD